MGANIPPVVCTRRSSGRGFLWLAIGLMLLGPVLYVFQLQAKILSVPWYVPTLASAGVALLVIAMLRTPTIWRGAILLLGGFLAGAEWYFLVSVSKVPAYSGPVSTEAPFPAFTTTRADGSVFDRDSLRGEQNSVLVFFRGRW